jgi:KAP family P-loop domain
MDAKATKGYDAAEVHRQEDDLDRWRFTSEIVDVILATPPEWSARIGVFGKWGEGKSTVLRFAETMLREKGSVVFTFSPWAIQNWNDLWESFGSDLSEALDTAGIQIDHSWMKMLKGSTKWLESTGVQQLAESAAGYLGKEKLYNAAFGAVSRWLKYDGGQVRAIREKLGGQRLVVLIDDLDRCAPELIPQLLLSLRELLDLPGFTFILAFDDEVVAESLVHKNPAWVGSNFLEKILDFRFHLPEVTEKQKERLTLKAISRYCNFVPSESTKSIQDLLPGNPRKLKSLIRSLAAIRPQLVRHDPDELNWVDIWLAQMLRLESHRFLDRLLKGNTLDAEISLHELHAKRHSRNKSNDEDGNASLRGLLSELGIEEPDLIFRIRQLVVAARARASMRFRYMCELALRPHAVTWKEFRLLNEAWQADRQPALLNNWISQHAIDRAVSTDDVETELFQAMIGRRGQLLSGAAEANSVVEAESQLQHAGALLEMIGQFFLDLRKLNAHRFQKLYDQAAYWIGFRKNYHDQMQREEEEQMLLRTLASASDVLSVAILENLLPDGWDIDMGDGTIPLKKSLREKCYNLVAPKAAKASLSFLVRDDGMRNLSERGRFRGAKHCLFDPSSPLRKGDLRNEFLALIRSGLGNHTVYVNVREYLQMLVRGLQPGTEIDFVGNEKLTTLLQDAEFVRSLWQTATSREIQYRMQISFIQARQSLIDAGALEDALPLTDELNSRILEEESRKAATDEPSTTASGLAESA